MHILKKQAVFFGTLLIFAGNALAADTGIHTGAVSLEEAKTVFENSCAECHGQKVFNWGFPALYGMKEKYFIKQVKNYRNKTRLDRKLPYGGMNSYVEDWSDELIAAVAKYVSTRSLCEVSKDSIVNDRGGDVKKGAQIAADNTCLDCHNNGTTIPIASQQTRYMTKQLAQFKTGDRKDGVMQGIAEGLSDKDMLDVAAYFNGLRSCNRH